MTTFLRVCGLVLLLNIVASGSLAFGQGASGDENIALPPGTMIGVNPDFMNPDQAGSSDFSIDHESLIQSAEGNAEFEASVGKIRAASENAWDLILNRQELISNADLVSTSAQGPMYRLREPIELRVGKNTPGPTPASSTVVTNSGANLSPTWSGGGSSTSPHSSHNCADHDDLNSQAHDLSDISESVNTPGGPLSGRTQGVDLANNLNCQQQEAALRRASGSAPEMNSAQIQSAVSQGVNAQALQEAIASMRQQAASGLIRNSNMMVVTDFSRPSSENRMHMIEILDSGRVRVTSVRASHGQGSDPDHDGRMNCFRNGNGSHGTPGGSFVTGGTYQGSKGYSLRMMGLESQNRNTCNRAVVFHPASYVQSSGRLGRSWGCPALDPRVSRQVIDTIKGGTFIYHYGDSRQRAC